MADDPKDEKDDEEYELPADGAIDDEGLFEVRRDEFNNNLYLK